LIDTSPLRRKNFLDQLEIKAKTRTTKGNGPARALRREGHVPAVLYGPSTEPQMLSVSAYDLDMTLKKGNISRAILSLAIDDQPSRIAMVKELQQHPVTGDVLHLDLYEIDMARKIKVNVPISTTGKSKGIELGGMLQIIRRELEVLCLPNAIPETITIDITDLDIGDSVHVEEIPLGENIELPLDVNFTVLTIVSPKIEAVPEEEEEEALEGEEEAAEGEEGEASEPQEES
jgi:large subunit ribosomal protein L25